MSSEEDVHYISDQDSGDDKPQIESIIKEKTKIFKNESYAIKIMLSEHHQKVRSEFFTKVRRVHSGIYQAIKREIRNCLNPYRIFGKDIQIKKELQELYELLKVYYKEKNFNNTFFINYFTDLEKAHNKESKSKFVNMLPKDEIETLNDIQRKVVIIRNLRHYLNTSIRDRLQINYEQKKEIYEEDDFIMMYKYMTIKQEKFSEMGDEELMKYISNKKGSYKLRRPLNDFNVYNYLPILCKGYCQKEAKLFIQFFQGQFQSHASECTICKDLLENFEEVENQIKSLYTKTCIFSHNINEIMFHPLVFNSFSNPSFYLTQLKKEEINGLKNLVDTNKPSEKYMKFKNVNTRMIYNPADNGMKEIFNKLKEYSSKNDLYGNKCYFPDYKTQKCPLELFMPNTQDFSLHINKCKFYHSSLEKRRNKKIKENEICKEVIKGGKWRNDEENIKCQNFDDCNKFHTRNELFYDKRNYRKLYPCSYTSKYCERGTLCPRKHPTDMKIEEIYLPLKSKNELERELKKLIDKEKRMKNSENKISKIQCKSCLNYIDGIDGKNLYIFKNCNHIICSECFKYFNLCPLCGFNKEDNNEEEGFIFIQLDYELKPQIKENDEETIEEQDDNEEEEEEENEEEYNDEESKENKDKEVKDIEDNEEEEVENDNYLFKTNNDITLDEKNSSYSNENSMAKEANIRKNNNNENYSFDDENEKSYNTFTFNNLSISSRGSRKGVKRGGRGKGGRGGRGRGNYSNSNFNDESNNFNSRGRKGYKRGGSIKSSYYDENENEKKSKANESEDNDNISKKSDKSEDNENSFKNSMIENAKRERGNRRGRGTVRGGRGRGINRKNYEEEDNKSSDEEKDKHFDCSNSKKISDDEVNEVSD